MNSKWSNTGLIGSSTPDSSPILFIYSYSTHELMCYRITGNFCGYLICAVFCAYLHTLIFTWLFKTDTWRFIKYVHSITCNKYTCFHDADPHCKHFLWLKILNLSLLNTCVYCLRQMNCLHQKTYLVDIIETCLLHY